MFYSLIDFEVKIAEWVLIILLKTQAIGNNHTDYKLFKPLQLISGNAKAIPSCIKIGLIFMQIQILVVQILIV